MSKPPEKRFLVMVWLLPGPRERKFFQAIISRLAAEFDAPVFQPHLTLGAFRAGSALPSSIETISLAPIGVFSESIFTKTLFIRFDFTDSLRKLRASLGLGGRRYDPHLSLLYSRLPPRKKRDLAKSISLPFPIVRFDQITLVRCLSPTRTKAEVQSWRVVPSTQPARREPRPRHRARTATERDSIRGIKGSRPASH
jgi:2'-5' RNA ligase